MRTQFLGLGWYASTRALGKNKSKWSIAEILGEASRDKNCCPHVENRKPPILVYGCPLSEIEQKAEAWAKTQRQKNGKAYRRDSPSLAAGVITWPDTWSEVGVDQWPAYRDLSIDLLREKHGERLVSVVEHTDEPHPHIHFFVIPLMGESFGSVHEGYAASRKAREDGKDPVRAYREAMSALLNWFYGKVGCHFNLARKGESPRRCLTGREIRDLWLQYRRALIRHCPPTHIGLLVKSGLLRRRSMPPIGVLLEAKLWSLDEVVPPIVSTMLASLHPQSSKLGNTGCMPSTVNIDASNENPSSAGPERSVRALRLPPPAPTNVEQDIPAKLPKRIKELLSALNKAIAQTGDPELEDDTSDLALPGFRLKPYRPNMNTSSTKLNGDHSENRGEEGILATRTMSHRLR